MDPEPTLALGEPNEEMFTEPEWLEWFALTPQQRWTESAKLWAHYLEIGGTLDPEPDTQSPFFDPDTPGPKPADGRTGLRVIRRSGV
jgi:hypothetical protein